MPPDCIGADPSVGSAGVSARQPRFDGSDRQARGALMKVLGMHPVARHEVPAVIARSAAVAERVVDGLIADRLCIDSAGSLHLP